MELRIYLSSIWFLAILTQISCENTPEVSIYEEYPSRNSDRIKLDVNPITIQGMIGESLVMECRVFQKPLLDSRVVWQKKSTLTSEDVVDINDGFTSRDTSKWKIGQGRQQDSYRLEIMALTSDYEGIYSCTCYYSRDAEAARDMRKVEVYQSPRILPYESSYDLTHQVNDKALLTCGGEGIPPPTFRWEKIGGETSVIRGHGRVKSGNTITFDSVQPRDAGEYVCYATNTIGQAMWKVMLSITHKPIITIFPNAASAKQKAYCSYELLCKVNANPQVSATDVFWSSGGNTLTTDNKRITVRFLVAANKNVFLSLSLDPILPEDFRKTFTCTAKNVFESVSESIRVEESTIAYPGRKGLIECSASGKVYSPIIFVSILSLSYFTKKFL